MKQTNDLRQVFKIIYFFFSFTKFQRTSLSLLNKTSKFKMNQNYDSTKFRQLSISFKFSKTINSNNSLPNHKYARFQNFLASNFDSRHSFSKLINTHEFQTHRNGPTQKLSLSHFRHFIKQTNPSISGVNFYEILFLTQQRSLWSKGSTTQIITK